MQCRRLHQIRRHVVQQINRNISLICYHRFGEDLLELGNTACAGSARTTKDSKAGTPLEATDEPAVPAKAGNTDEKVAEHLATMPESLAVLLAPPKDFVLSLGDHMQRKEFWS